MAGFAPHKRSRSDSACGTRPRSGRDQFRRRLWQGAGSDELSAPCIDSLCRCRGRRAAPHLLRVEIEGLTDVGAVSPLLGGAGVRYDPLPARMVSQRRRLAFVYHDGRRIVRLHFAEARALRDDSAPSQIAIDSKP